MYYVLSVNVEYEILAIAPSRLAIATIIPPESVADVTVNPEIFAVEDVVATVTLVGFAILGIEFVVDSLNATTLLTALYPLNIPENKEAALAAEVAVESKS